MAIITHYSLPQLGWKVFFQQQLSLDELTSGVVARVVIQQRSELILLTEQGESKLAITPSIPPVTVGDWLLLGNDGKFIRLLERTSLFQRKAAGTKVNQQLIAANIDSVFIVCSLNQDFNLNRIERYLALAHEADVTPVVVLSKADRCEAPEEYISQAQGLDSLLIVVAVNGLDHDSVEQLKPWCGQGDTIAVLGSSGVGKSTLINTLLGEAAQKTKAIRADDDKGRHTTTGRSLHLLSSGGLLLDTPGMRELQLADCEHGIEDTFAEITQLTSQCRFSDCQHESEPGCAVLAAVGEGTLDERRLVNYHKLMREQAINSETLAEKRARDKDLGRFYRTALTSAKRFKRNDD